MNKLAPMFLLFFITATAAASTNFNGFYARAGIGGTEGHFSTVQPLLIDLTPALGFRIEVPHVADISDTAISALVGIGYAYRPWGNFSIGFELTAGMSGVNAKEDVQVVSTNVGLVGSNQINTKLQNDFALLLKPGYIFRNHTFFYALLGPRWGNFDTTNEVSFTAEFVPGFPSLGSAKTTQSKYELGFTAGLGLERYITSQFTLGLEYAYTTYGNISIPSESASIIGGGTVFLGDVTSDSSFTAFTNQVMLNLAYRF